MRTIEINGKDFDSIEGFYDFIEKDMLDGKCPWGRNLDSLEEIVQSNFNYTNDKKKDVIKIVWRNFSKSETELRILKNDIPIINILDDILKGNKTIQFEKS